MKEDWNQGAKSNSTVVYHSGFIPLQRNFTFLENMLTFPQSHFRDWIKFDFSQPCLQLLCLVLKWWDVAFLIFFEKSAFFTFKPIYKVMAVIKKWWMLYHHQSHPWCSALWMCWILVKRRPEIFIKCWSGIFLFFFFHLDVKIFTG